MKFYLVVGEFVDLQSSLWQRNLSYLVIKEEVDCTAIRQALFDVSVLENYNGVSVRVDLGWD